MDRGGGAGYIPSWMNSELKSDRRQSRGAAPRTQLQQWARPLRRLLLALALVVAALGPAAPSAAQEGEQAPTEVEAARDRVLGNSAYQTEKPQPEEPPDIPDFTIPPWLVEALLWFFGALVVGAVVYLLVNLLLEMRGGRAPFWRRGKPSIEAGEIVETPVVLDRETRERSLEEADALAAEGRYAEAIHLLLLVALERLRRELGPRVAPALTSREVLQVAPVPEAVAAPLARMVALSEIKHFGGRDAAAPDYRSCRRDFLHFSTGEPAGA